VPFVSRACAVTEVFCNTDLNKIICFFL
jgi:hypothetical protein